MKTPLVSVVMAVHNEEQFLKQAIFSILNQSLNNLELIVVDDYSTDSSPKIIRSIKDNRLKLLKNSKQLGLTKSLNKALKIARGEYIARMDADDISTKERLKIQVSYLNKHTNIVVVGSWAQYIDKNGNVLKVKKVPLSSVQIKKDIPKYNPFIHPTLVFRADVFKKIGLYDENFYYAQDYDLLLRIAKKYKTANIPKNLLFYRISSDQISTKTMSRQLMYAFKARLKAMKEGNLSKWRTIHLIKPAISLLIPQAVKKPLINLFLR